jgi:hypothetical protein
MDGSFDSEDGGWQPGHQVLTEGLVAGEDLWRRWNSLFIYLEFDCVTRSI